MDMLTLPIVQVLLDGVYTAFAAAGFAAVSNPPRKSFIYVPLISAIGHMLRFVMMKYWGVEIGIASFFAAMLIGCLGIYFAHRERYPSEIFSFPALLPMIPGMYAYKALLGMIRFMQSHDEITRASYIPQIVTNSITAVIIMMALAVGVAVPLFTFYKHSFRMTRRKNPSSRKAIHTQSLEQEKNRPRLSSMSISMKESTNK